MTASDVSEIKSLKQKITEQKQEIAALHSQLGVKKGSGMSNETIDGIIFTVILIAVVGGLVFWLSNMPS